MYKCEYTGHSGDHTLYTIHTLHVLLVVNYIVFFFLTMVNNSPFLVTSYQDTSKDNIIMIIFIMVINHVKS